MSTDTATLVTKLIIENDYDFSQIPFIDEPLIEGVNENSDFSSVLMEGFRYVS